MVALRTSHFALMVPNAFSGGTGVAMPRVVFMAPHLRTKGETSRWNNDTMSSSSAWGRGAK